MFGINLKNSCLSLLISASLAFVALVDNCVFTINGLILGYLIAEFSLFKSSVFSSLNPTAK